MATARNRFIPDVVPDVCPKCWQAIRWTPWRPYPPRWTGAPSRGEVRSGSCDCGEAQYVADRLPPEPFARVRERR